MLTLHVNGVEGWAVLWWLRRDGKVVSHGRCKRFSEAATVLRMARERDAASYPHVARDTAIGAAPADGVGVEP